MAGDRWALLRYYLRQVGLRDTLRWVSIDLAEQVSTGISKRLPWLALSPRSIQIECTTRCNLKCVFCELSYWNETPTDITLETVGQLLAQLPRLRRVNLSGIGESLMNRDFFPIVELLRSRAIGVTITDNFTMMSAKNARRVVSLGVDHVVMSLDGATKETYEKIRVGASFEKVVANAKRFIEIRREMGRRAPEVRLHTVVCSANYHELPEIVELAHEIGLGMVAFGKVLTFESTAGLETESIRAEVIAKLAQAARRGRELGVLVQYEQFEKRPVQQCDLPWRRNFVTHTGHVHPCCYTSQRGDRRAQNARSLGNLLEESFDELWRGARFTGLRRKMKDGIVPQECTDCPLFDGRPDATQVARRSAGLRTLR